MLATIASILAQTEAAEEVSEAKDLYPEPGELIIGLLAFLVLLYFTWRWVIPRFNEVLEERRQKIQGELERAEGERAQAKQLQEEYRQQLAGAREEANGIIEKARATAEEVRRDLQARAEEQAEATVARAREEIGAERERAFQELRSQVGQIAVELAERVVEKELDSSTHEQLIDEYITQVTAGPASNGDGSSRGA